jgi:REP element-mobilizing transposase RayT
MVIAYHVIFTTYGTWLPNDPRGAYSTTVYNDELKALGAVQYGKQDPPPSRDRLRRFWTSSRGRTKRRQFFVDDSTRRIIAQGFDQVVKKFDLTVHACAIMNDHVHLLLLRSKNRIEYIAGQFKAEATRALSLTETPWAKRSWKVFIEDYETMASAAHYIEMNPIKAGQPRQHWDFVTPLSPPTPEIRQGRR